ncbi:VOC family protein [Anaerobacillus sp. HL2]|nr:VOC family protein [Anaerobacillus sp. HL2]
MRKEIDYFWSLSAVPEAEQCGWVKDKFGVSYLNRTYRYDKDVKSGDKEQKIRVTKAFLKMKKFDIEALQKAYDGV